MREALSAPATMQGLLRYFHRSRAASADKHLCARGTTLWTHIRNLVCKGKVGWGWALVSLGGGGAVSGQGLCCPGVSVSSCPCPFACLLRLLVLSS